MKKILLSVSFIFILLLVGCTKSYSEIHSDISGQYQSITIERFVEKTPIVLPYNEGNAILGFEDNFYYIDFNLETTYLYHSSNKQIIRYTDKLDLEYSVTSQSLIDFIYEIESVEKVSFRKANYLIFDVIRSALEDQNKSYIHFDSNRPNRGFLHPKIVIKKEHYEKIDRVSLILSEVEGDLPNNITITLDKHQNTSIYCSLLDTSIHSKEDIDLTNHIKQIIQDIK